MSKISFTHHDLSKMEASFLKATSALQLRNYAYAIPELEKARSHPKLRRQVMHLLVKAYKARGLEDLSRKEQDAINKEFPDDDAPPSSGVISPLRPISPNDSSTAKKFPRD